MLKAFEFPASNFNQTFLKPQTPISILKIGLKQLVHLYRLCFRSLIE